MKKIYFVLSCLFFLIPSQLFSIEKMVDEMHTNYVNGNIIGVKVLYEQIDNSTWDDASKVIAKTYYLMAKSVLAERVDIEDVDANIKDIENLLGVDNKYYAYAVYCKSQTNPDDMSLVENGFQLIKNSCGEDSWEYGVAVCNYAVAVGNNTRDYKKTVSILNNGISIIEKVNPNSWFLPIAFSNKAMYMLLLGDSGCFEELNKAEKSVFALPDDNSIVPLFTFSYTYLTIMGALPDSDFKELRSFGISMLETFDEKIYKENELYCALLQSVATVCYRIGDKKDCLKYMDEAVSIIEGIYGKDSSKYNSFVKNRSYFANN